MVNESYVVPIKGGWCSEQAERAVPTAGFFLALAGANGRLALFSVLCVKCPWRLSGVRGLWPHVYWRFNWSAGLLRVFRGLGLCPGHLPRPEAGCSMAIVPLICSLGLEMCRGTSASTRLTVGCSVLSFQLCHTGLNYIACAAVCFLEPCLTRR